MKNLKSILLSASVLVVLAACGPTAENAPEVEVPVIEMPAYVAVDGVVYDVTDNAAWAGGEHVDEFPAGNDYTEEILSSPHGESLLEGLPVVGNLVD